MLPSFSLQLAGESGSRVSAWRPKRTPLSLLLPLLPVPDWSSVLLAVVWFPILAFSGFCVCMCVYLHVLERVCLATMCWEKIRAQKS